MSEDYTAEEQALIDRYEDLDRQYEDALIGLGPEETPLAELKLTLDHIERSIDAIWMKLPACYRADIIGEEYDPDAEGVDEHDLQGL